jgi:hypothetical protein
MISNTDFSSKCAILNDVWTNHRSHEFFEEFIETKDLGLPLSYFIHNGIVETTILANAIIDETFADLLELFEYEDEGFTSLQDFWGFA